MTQETITIREPADLVPVIPRMMGFHPSESMVVVGLGGAPLARVDIDEPVVTLAAGFASALPQWHRGVVVVFYTTDRDLARRKHRDLPLILPTLDIIESLAMTGNDLWKPYDMDFHALVDPEVPTDSRLDEVEVADNRDIIVKAVEKMTDVDAVEDSAVEAYGRGDGAAAWIYLERARALRGATSDRMAYLAQLLYNAVQPPKTP